MTRIFSLILLALAGTLLLRSQSIEQLDEKIVQIQRSTSYINGSDFRTDELTARKRAFNELADQVNSRRVDAGKPVINPRQLMEYAEEITYEDDGYYRVIFYVSAAEVMSLKEGDHPAVPRKALRHASGEAPDIFAGAGEAATPARPEPEQKPAPEPAKEPAPAPVPPAPVPEPKPEPSPAPAPSTPPAAPRQPDTRRQGNPLPPGNVSSDYVAKALAGIETYEEAALYLKKFRDDGYVTGYAFARNRSEIQPDMYLLVVDGDKRVAAVLMPQQGSLRKNLLSGRNEDIDTYLGNHYILWFRCR